MERIFNKGDILIFLGDDYGINPINTCISHGEEVTLKQIHNKNLIEVTNRNNTNQSCRFTQVKHKNIPRYIQWINRVVTDKEGYVFDYNSFNEFRVFDTNKDSPPRELNTISWEKHLELYDFNYIEVTHEEYLNQTKVLPETKKLENQKLPSSGWCKDATSDLGVYLSKKFSIPFIPVGTHGYAWNSNSYWAINSVSGKSEYSWYSLSLIIKEEEEEIEKFPIGTIVYVTQRTCGHGFLMGEKLQIVEKSLFNFRCKSLDRKGIPLYCLVSNEFKKDDTKSLISLELNNDTINRESDVSSLNYLNIKEIESINCPSSINTKFGELIDRTIKPLKFKDKVEITKNKGLIVPLNTIKNRKIN